MIKIKSSLIKNRRIDLQKTYEQIFKDGTIWKFSRFDGIHSVIYDLLKNKLHKKAVIDVGCGAGRLSFYLSLKASRVVGIDFSRNAINKANYLLSITHLKNIKFSLNTIEEVNDKFDIVVFADVIEHVKNPVDTLNKAKSILNDNGLIIFSCPGFMNLRGTIYKTLLHSLTLPMSLADLRQVDHLQVKNWCIKTGLKLNSIVGGLYDLGWSKSGIEDLKDRMPKVLKDKQIKDFDLNNFNKWVNNEKMLYDHFYKYLLKNYIIKPRKFPKLSIKKPIKLNSKKWDIIKNYLVTGFLKNPYYCIEYPYNLFGGEQIFILEK